MDKFKIINKTGIEYDVMPKGYEPVNFGYSNVSSFSRMGNRYYNTLEYLNQEQPEISVCFPLETAEVDYFKFVNFLQDAPLKLMISYDDYTFYKDIRINEVSKTWLPVELVEATVSFNSITPFYRVLRAINDPTISYEGKIYDYTYNYRYTDNEPMTIYIDTDTYTDSPIKLEIYGECVNPKWSYFQNGKLISTGALNVTIPTNRKVVIDSTTLPYSIKMFDLADNLIGDLYDASDFSTERFIYFRNGRNRITISQDNSNPVVLGVEAQIYYASI